MKIRFVKKIDSKEERQVEVVRRVLLADTGEELRRSLASGLSSETDMQVVGQTGDGVELLRMIRELKPDIVVMELVLTGMDGRPDPGGLPAHPPDDRISRL